MNVYEGIRILDFTQFQQGPVATQMLGDFGAEVIKIERPGTGDGFRGSSATGALNQEPGCYAMGFIACNRNKKSIAMNLKDDRAKQIIYDLVKISDVTVANFRPGVMEKLGFGYDKLSAINPRIICAYGTGYGLSGPDRDTLGQDMMAQCRSGLVKGEPPHTAGYNVCDQYGGMMLAMGIMLALTAREKTGKGQVVDSCLLNSGLTLDMPNAVRYLNEGPREEKKTKNPTYALYKTNDGKWVHIIDAFRDEPLRRQCKALGISESVPDDPRFADVHNLSPEDFDELSNILADAVARYTAKEVVERFQEQDMMAVPVNSLEEAFNDPQTLHNEMIIETEHPRTPGKLKMVGFPIKLSDTPASIRFAPPLLGEHNEEVLGGLLGISEKDIASLYEDNVLGH